MQEVWNILKQCKKCNIHYNNVRNVTYIITRSWVIFPDNYDQMHGTQVPYKYFEVKKVTSNFGLFLIKSS